MYSEKEKKYFIEREQEDAKGSIKIIKRDFFDDLPRAVCEVLDNISWRWRNYDWFEEAWNKYRDHVINASAGGLAIKAPGFVFNSYIDDQVKEDFLNRENAEILHSDLCLDELFNRGVKMEENDELAHKWRVSSDCPEESRRGQFCSEDDPYAEPIGGSPQQSTQNTTKQTNNTSSKDPQRDVINQMKKDNENARVINEWNRNQNAANEAARKATEDDVKRSQSMLDEGRNITTNLANMFQEHRGSKRVNPKETNLRTNRPYSELSDDELNKLVRRMQLERQYGDLTGDAKYEQTGKEKTREFLQTIGSVLGVLGSALGIYMMIHQKKNS